MNDEATEPVAETVAEAADVIETTEMTAPTDPTETTTAPRAKDAAGRTRPTQTIERDAITLAKMNELIPAKYTYGISRNELATELELDPAQVYLCLYRLNRDGKIKRTSSGARARWAMTEYDVPIPPPPVVVEIPAETPTEPTEAPEVPAV
jgi:predicted Rossmann fold nucleotide-binding protein DprA/Smf involved in DNA uptake